MFYDTQDRGILPVKIKNASIQLDAGVWDRCDFRTKIAHLALDSDLESLALQLSSAVSLDQIAQYFATLLRTFLTYYPFGPYN